MGKVTSGEAKGYSGKVGNKIYKQQKDGTTTVSEVAVLTDTPPSDKQLSTYQDTRVSAYVLKSLLEFIEMGYELQGKLAKISPYNAIISYIRRNVLTGVYPDRHLDFSKLLVSKGKMQTPVEATVSLTKTGLSFTWNPDSTQKGIHFSDQVMLLAYFPELNEASYLTAGAQRRAGKDALPLAGIKKGYVAEVYISFISNNRKSVSDSVYLGQVNW